MPPILKPHDLVDLGKVLLAHNMYHTFLLVDYLPGALTSPVNGAQIANLPPTLIRSFENILISYNYDATQKSWTVSPLEANTAKSYICIFATDVRHTPGMANRMRGAISGLTDNLEKCQAHYATFFKILNGAASVMGPTAIKGNAASINSPILTQILGNLNMLHLKNDWTKFGAQDYKNIAKANHFSSATCLNFQVFA